MGLNQTLRLSLLDAFFFSLMVGAGETYLPAYALSAGLSEMWAGLFSTIPMIVGAFIQLLTPMLIVRVGSVKKWVVTAALLQAFSFLPLMYFSFAGVTHPIWLFFIAAVYWGAGFAAGPSWNYWMTHLVAENISTSYFSRRTRIVQVGTLLGIIGAGVALHNKVHVGPFTSTFSVIFLVAFIARASSGLILSAKEYQEKWFHQSGSVSLISSLRILTKDQKYRNFFGFMFVYYIAIFISGPFVAPFLLHKRHLDYGHFMGAIAALMIGKMACLPFADRLIKRWGLKNVFLLGALGIAPLPAMWVFANSYVAIFLLQVVSGGFWALFEVGLSLIFFDRLRKVEKIPILSLYNLFNASAIIVGSLIGAWLLNSDSESISAYYLIFLLAAFLRSLIAIGFAWQSRKEKDLL